MYRLFIEKNAYFLLCVINVVLKCDDDKYESVQNTM